MTYQCYNCQYYIFDNNCEAFPEGIPKEILTGEFDHTTIHPDQDNDILFEPEPNGDNK